MTTAAPPAASGTPVSPPSGSGLFTSFEEGDDVGKTTQTRILAGLLTVADVNHVLIREPGGTELGVEIRRLLLYGGHVAPRAEVLLCAADRAYHIATRVRLAPGRGAVVLANRYLDSSVAYQDATYSLGSQEVRDLFLWATEGLLPDLTVLLDGDPDLAERRTTSHGAKDRLGQKGDAFRVALRERFLTLAEGELKRLVVVDVDRPVDQVADDVIEAVVAAVHRHGVRLAYGGAHQGVLLRLEALVKTAARHNAAGSGAEVCS